MKKTKITFEDIKAGDLIQTLDNVHGVKWELTGIAYELADLGQGDAEWRTSQGGALVDNVSEDAIYRIDVREVSFDDVRVGDLIEVSAVRGDVERVIRGRAADFRASDGSWYDGWFTAEGNLLVRRKSSDKIVVLERGA